MSIPSTPFHRASAARRVLASALLPLCTQGRAPADLPWGQVGLSFTNSMALFLQLYSRMRDQKCRVHSLDRLHKGRNYERVLSATWLL